MPKAYEHTSVTVDETKGNIISIIAKYGGRLLNTTETPGRAILMVESNHVPPRILRIVLPLPVGNTKTVQRTCMRKWRALYNYIKAAYVAVDENIMVFEQAFMAWIVPNYPASNKTLYDEAREQRDLRLPPPPEPPSDPALH